MATFVCLVSWTDQGIRDVKDTIQRYERSQEVANKHGVSHEQIYWTVGTCDMVFIAQAPNLESISAYVLELGSAGNLRTISRCERITEKR